MQPNIFPTYKCRLPTTKMRMDLGSVSAKTNENSNINYNSLKNFRHGEKKLVTTRQCFPQIVPRRFSRMISCTRCRAVSKNLNQEVECFNQFNYCEESRSSYAQTAVVYQSTREVVKPELLTIAMKEFPVVISWPKHFSAQATPVYLEQFYNLLLFTVY